jgi:hypothetical protein
VIKKVVTKPDSFLFRSPAPHAKSGVNEPPAPDSGEQNHFELGINMYITGIKIIILCYKLSQAMKTVAKPI